MSDIYKYTTVESLIKEDAFVQWVQAGKPKDSAWYPRIARHQISEALINQAALIVTSFSATSDAAIDAKQSMIWERIDSATAETETRIKPAARSSTIIYWLSAAAAACLVALFFFTADPDPVIQHQSDHDMISINLPDQSDVKLSPQSLLSYDSSTWTEERRLSLSGEAFFEVEKGKTFEVTTEELIITVLGTSFNVDAKNENPNVTCFTGQVKVTSTADNSSIIINPNEKATLTPEGLIKKSYAHKIFIPWMEEDMSFTAAPLSQVFKAIEAAYQVSISYPEEVSEDLISATFPKGTLEESLYNITWPNELSYQIKEDKVIISKSK